MAAQSDAGSRRKPAAPGGTGDVYRRSLFLGLPPSIVSERYGVDPATVVDERAKLDTADGKPLTSVDALRGLDRALAWLVDQHAQQLTEAEKYARKQCERQPDEGIPRERWLDRWARWLGRSQAYDRECIGKLTARRVDVWDRISKLTGEAPPEDLHVHMHVVEPDPGDDPADDGGPGNG